jgi:selenide,water dikinase
VKTKHLKRNNTATEGDYLLLTKPIGVGILSTAQKRKKLLPEHYEEWTTQMIKLNAIGAQLGAIEGVSAMTDITGFGLLGHLLEMTTGSNLSMELYYDKVPILASARQYAAERIIPDATYRNWNAYSPFVQFEAGVNVMEAFNILPDPQTNGGLLVAVKETAMAQIKQLFSDNGYEYFLEPIGKMTAKREKGIYVR